MDIRKSYSNFIGSTRLVPWNKIPESFIDALKGKKRPTFTISKARAKIIRSGGTLTKKESDAISSGKKIVIR